MWTRRFTALVVAILLAGLAACDDGPANPANPPQSFEVHLQGGFAGDAVTVLLDDVGVYQGIVTTDPVVAHAAILRLSTASGPHVIRIAVDGTETTGTIAIDRLVYVLVSRDASTDALEIRTTLVRPAYR